MQAVTIHVRKYISHMPANAQNMPQELHKKLVDVVGPGKVQWDKIPFSFIPSIRITFLVKNKTRLETAV